MIRSFKGKFAAAIVEAEKGGKAPKGFPVDVMNAAIRKLSIIDKAISVTRPRVEELVRERRPMTADMAHRFSRRFGMTPGSG